MKPDSILENFILGSEKINLALRPLVEDLVKLDPSKAALLEHMDSLEKSVAEAKQGINAGHCSRSQVSTYQVCKHPTCDAARE